MSAEVAAGIIGLGFGANHARVLSEMEGVRLAAICDQDEARLSAVVTGREVHAYTSAREMLGRERLDAVVVAVPTRLHCEVALAAIERGVAVLVEKPLAPSLAEGRRLVDAANAAGVPLMAGHIERFNPVIQELARRVRAGELGAVLQMAARRLAYFRAGSREVDVGVIHDLAFHDIDVMRFIAGSAVERVFAETQTGVLSPLEDGVTGLLRFAARDGRAGAVGTLEVNWLSPRKVRDLHVLGELGLFVATYADYQSATLEYQPAQALRRTVVRRGEAAVVNLGGSEPDSPLQLEVAPREPLHQELAAFVAAVRAGGPMPVTGEDALGTLAVADALAESARSGQPVRPSQP